MCCSLKKSSPLQNHTKPFSLARGGVSLNSSLESVGLRRNLNLPQNYLQLLPLLFQHNFTPSAPPPSTLSLSDHTQHQLDLWQQHFSTADLDDTLAQLMDLASLALQSPTPEKTPDSTTEQSLKQPLSSPSPAYPWLAISRLTETVAHLTNQVRVRSKIVGNGQKRSLKK